MHFGHVEVIVEVVPVWRRLPLTSSHIDSFCTSAISSLVTGHGPNGPTCRATCPGPLTNARSGNCARNVVPDAIAGHVVECVGFSEQYLARVPMMAAISTSQSSLVEPRGFSTGRSGPQRAVLALRKKIGSAGNRVPSPWHGRDGSGRWRRTSECR